MSHSGSSWRAADNRGQLQASRRKVFIPEEKFPRRKHFLAR